MAALYLPFSQSSLAEFDLLFFHHPRRKPPGKQQFFCYSRDKLGSDVSAERTSGVIGLHVLRQASSVTCALFFFCDMLVISVHPPDSLQPLEDLDTQDGFQKMIKGVNDRGQDIDGRKSGNLEDNHPCFVTQEHYCMGGQQEKVP